MRRRKPAKYVIRIASEPSIHRHFKSARSRLEKATKSAHVKQQVTFNPTAVAGPSTPKPSTKPKRRVSLGFIVDTATGEVTGVDHGDGGHNKRKSQRKHTMLNTSATVKRLKKSEEKKVYPLFSCPMQYLLTEI